MGLSSIILDGMADILETAGVGTYDPAAPPATATETPVIVCGRLPTQPDRAVALSAYPVALDPILPNAEIGVQVRVRGTTAPAVALDLDDAVISALTGLTGLLFGAVPVSQIVFRSGSDIGVDSAGRHERVTNWAVYAERSHASLVG